MNRHRRIAVRTHDRRWFDVVVETKPSIARQPAPAPLPPVSPINCQPRRFRMERAPDGQPRTLEALS